MPPEPRQSDADKLLASEERFRLLVESVRDYAIFMLDAEGRVLSWNAGAQRFKGYPPDEIIGRHFSMFYTEEDRAAGRPAYALELARSGEGGMPLVSDYALAIITGVAEEIDRIDEILASYLTDWSLDRLAAVDRTALRIGLWELLFTDDVPALTAVDEAVSLAREYSDDDAPRFVNGVLDKVLRDRDVLKEQLSHTSTVDVVEEESVADDSTPAEIDGTETR